jgi:hypothetical protein
MSNVKSFATALCALVITALPCWGQQEGGHRVQPQASGTANAEFLQAADEVLAEMSKILSLPVKEPLKKSVRSREEIREFLIRQMREDKDDTKRYADQKALEALGLIPKGYPLDQKLLALLLSLSGWRGVRDSSKVTLRHRKMKGREGEQGSIAMRWSRRTRTSCQRQDRVPRR